MTSGSAARLHRRVATATTRTSKTARRVVHAVGWASDSPPEFRVHTILAAFEARDRAGTEPHASSMRQAVYVDAPGAARSAASPPDGSLPLESPDVQGVAARGPLDMDFHRVSNDMLVGAEALK